jgi:hypothetical protein
MSEISKQALLVDNSQSFPNNNAGAITPSDLRAFNVNMIDSLVDEISYNVDSSSWNNSISRLNTFTSSQQPQFNALNSFTASQLTINTGVNQFTQSANGRLGVLETNTANLNQFTSSINQIIVNGASIGTSTRLFFNGFVSASIVPNVDGAIASITVLSDPSKLNSSSFNDYTASTAASQSVFSASVATSFSQSAASLSQYSASQNLINVSVNAFTASQIAFNTSISSSVQELLDLSSSLSGGYATQGELDQSASVLQGNINVLSSFTGSYATTGSNVFTGDQTLIDNAGNFFTITDASGSLMLVGKSMTSSSLHLSQSVATAGAGAVNLIFKTNNLTPDTIISGSNNIFGNPNTPTAGFKRYLTNNNIAVNGANVPQISGSMTFSPNVSANYIGGNAQTITMRGPVSSSTWTIAANNTLGQVNIGQTAANHAQGLVSGFAMTGNYQNGALNIIANKANLSQPTSINNNNIGGTLNLTPASSSIAWQGNTSQGTVSLTNEVSGSGLTVLSSSNAVFASQNLIAGTSTINATGAGLSDDPTGEFFNRTIERNLIAGNNNIVRLSGQTTGSSTLTATAIIGNSLVVTGSSASPSYATGIVNYGSAFFGRFNSLTGNSDMSAETVFAVGTGTSASNRKTGFLIDSGSNTFIEGSLTISGSVYGNVSASTITTQTASIDLSVANYFTLTLSGSTRINVTNPRPGVTATLVINTDTGASASFSSNVKQPSGSFYASSPSGNIDIISFTAVDSTTVYAFPAQSFV